MGDRMLFPRAGNPKGFFEDQTVNRINDDIIYHHATFFEKMMRGDYVRLKPRQRRYDQWLACFPLDKKLEAPVGINQQIEELTQREPFCFKDPRFSYTLPIWRPYLKNTVYICLFRDPSRTANSIIKILKSQPELQSIQMTYDKAICNYEMMYSHILQIHRHTGDWLFLHYDQVAAGDGLQRLAEFTGANVDFNFPDHALNRTESCSSVPESAATIYEQLCTLASYDG